MQTPLSDDSAGTTEEDDCATFSELELDDARPLEDSASFSELELSAFFADEDSADIAELELTFAELDNASDELDRATDELKATTGLDISEDEDPSPTATGEPSESPHAVIEKESATEEAKAAAGTKPKINLRKFIILIYIKKRSLAKLRFLI